MRTYRKIPALILIIFSLCFMVGCGSSEEETTQPTEIDESKIVIETAPPSATEAADTDEDEQATGSTTTPSGMSVTPKVQKYKVLQGCNIRSDSNSSSALMGSLFGGEIVEGTGVCENGWIQIEYSGESCYVTDSCLEETQEDGEVTNGETEDDNVSEEVSSNITEFFEDSGNSRDVDVTDWAKYTSSKWESSDTTSCYMQIHSVAGNTVIFRLQVIDGAVEDRDKEGTLVAEITNCTGKIENGILGFGFTDTYGNMGVGKMEIVDDTHLSIATVITDPAEGAEYKAEIMTELTEVDS